MALVKQSTWRSMQHSFQNYLSDFTSGVSDVFLDAINPVNGAMNESLRDDIPADETEEERLEREQQEREDREEEMAKQEQLEEEERILEEQEWQKEQDRILEQETSEPGTFSKIYDAFKESSFYAGYSGVRNLMIGGALVGAGLGVTGTTGLAAAAAIPVASTAADLFRAARERLYSEQEVLRDEQRKLEEAEAQAAQGVPEDQRQGQADVGTMEYNNIKAKEKTRDQKQVEIDAVEEQIQKASDGSKKVDPAYIEQSVNELMAGIQMEPESAFDFERG